MSDKKTKPFVMFPKEVLFHEDLSIHSKLFFSSLLHWDRGSGRGCFASRQTMSKMTGLSLYHIRESIKELVDWGLITEIRRGLGQTNLIHIVIDEEKDQKKVGETISSQEVKSVDSVSIYSNKETSINRFDDDTDLDTDLEEEKQTSKQTSYGDSKTMEVKEESIYEEDTDVVLENTNTLLTTISQRVRPTGMTYFQNLKVIRKNNQEITLYESNEIVRDFLIMEYLEFLSEISDGRVVNIVGVNEIEKNLNIKQPSSSIGPDF